MPDAPGDRAPPSSRDIVKSQVDLGAGLFLIALALIGIYGSLGLRFGQLTNVGPALMPRSVAVLIGAFGIGLVVTSFLSVGPRLERWHFRGPLFVLGGVLVFAGTIRPAGLIVAGPLVVIISSLADRETKLVDVAVLAVCLTLLCGLVFKELLNLPIPFDPTGLVPEPVFRAYGGVKAELVRFFVALKGLFAR